MERMTYGVEIEVERASCFNFPRTLNSKGWRKEEDGSLRNEGIEYVSPILTSIEEVKVDVARVLKYLKNKGAVASYRCGIHLHVGTVSRDEAFSYLKAYLPYERMIFDIYPERKDNNFCVPILDSNFSVSDMEYLEDWGKYSALNFTPVLLQGTVEYRMMSTELKEDRFFKLLDIVESINAVFKGQDPSILPPSVDIIEAETFLQDHVSEETSPILSREEVEKLFGIRKEDDNSSIEIIIDKLAQEFIGELESCAS